MRSEIQLYEMSAMADVCYIRCPECDEKFKSTSDKEGKKIRCPECDEPFKVTAKMMSQPKGEAVQLQGHQGGRRFQQVRRQFKLQVGRRRG